MEKLSRDEMITRETENFYTQITHQSDHYNETTICSEETFCRPFFLISA